MFKVVSVLLCVFMRCWQSDGNMSLLKQVPDIISQLCPGSNVCSSNTLSKTSDDSLFRPGTESCCGECSCLTTCANNGICCYPDRLPEKRIVESNDFQKDQLCLYPMIPQPLEHQRIYQSFIMISSVQRPRIVGEFNVSCGDMNVAPWGNFYPVYSAKSKQIYKNIECAREDSEGSDDFIYWDAYVHCKNEEMDQSINTLVNGLDNNSFSESCEVNFVFPGDYDDIQPHKCFINLVNTCKNSRRDFDVPEGINMSKDDIRTLCTDSGIISPYRAIKLYANVFCHICSGELFVRTITCNKVFVSSNGRGGIGGGFIALIDGNFITENRDKGNTWKRQMPIACSVKIEDMCRPIFCPTGQIRDRKRKCVYPIKVWYDQNYAVYVNLTLYQPINVSEVFYSNNLPSLKSAWLNRWDIAEVYFRVMDMPFMSNNLVITLYGQWPQVKPDTMIKNIKKMIGQTWSIQLGNNTEETMISANFSLRTQFWKDPVKNTFDNLTEEFEMRIYKNAYETPIFVTLSHLISGLYICDQVELEPSDFLLSNEMDMIYIYKTKRFLFNGQFTLLLSQIDVKYRARVCLDDSWLYHSSIIKNVGRMQTAHGYYVIVTSLLLIFLH